MKARIERVNKWASGKGCFFQADGKPYYTNETAELPKGVWVDFDTDESKTLGDKNAVLATHVRVAQETPTPGTPPKAAGLSGDQEARITRAVALKCAAQQITASNAETRTNPELAARTTEIARIYEAYLNGGSKGAGA